jgi:hypothetical protein
MAGSIKNEEYERLKASFEILFRLLEPNFDSLPNNIRPTTILTNMEKTSPAAARAGLQMAISDMVEMTTSWQPDRLFEVDKALSEKSLLTLSDLRARFSKKYAALLKRGVVRDIVEYYLLKGVRDEALLEPHVFEQIDLMLNAYENSRRG